MKAEKEEINNKTVQLSTDSFFIKMKDNIFEKLLKKACDKKEERRTAFLEENLGNGMRKFKDVKITGDDWDVSLEEFVKLVEKEL